MNRSSGALFLVILVVFLNACSFTKLIKGKKQNVYVWKKDSTDSVTGIAAPPVLKKDTVAPATPAPGAGPTQEKGMAEAAPYWNNRLKFKTFSGKAKVHISSPDDKEEFTAHIRVRKDSVIWMNITALGGILFAKVFITTDSFFFINYIQKTYLDIPLSRAAKILPTKVDFNSLQNLVVGDPLRQGDLARAVFEADTVWVTTVDTGFIQELNYSASDSTLRATRLVTRRPDGPNAEGDYSVYLKIGAQKVSSNRTLVIRNGPDEYQLDMNFTKIDLDEPLDYRFSIPQSYSRKE